MAKPPDMRPGSLAWHRAGLAEDARKDARACLRAAASHLATGDGYGAAILREKARRLELLARRYEKP